MHKQNSFNRFKMPKIGEIFRPDFWILCGEFFMQIRSVLSANQYLYTAISINVVGLKSSENRVFGLETFSEFSHIIEIIVNALMPPTNQTQRSISAEFYYKTII